jgi:hypothetical protein
MSNLIWTPGSGAPPEAAPATRQEFRLPEITIPAPLAEDLRLNPDREREFYITVGKAVNRSFENEATRVRTISATVVRERIEACYSCLVVLRNDLKYSWRKCFDLLPSCFVESLIRGERPEDTFERTAPGNAWANESEPQQVQVTTDPSEDLNAEAATVVSEE